MEVDVQQGNFKILWLLLQILILFLVEKWNPPSRSKTIEIGQKIEEILGVNCQKFVFLCEFQHNPLWILFFDVSHLLWTLLACT